jgi:hypothetical protein
MITCPHCGQNMPKTYRFRLDDADMSALRKIHQWVLENGTYYVDVRKVCLTYTERSRTTQLRFHGLLAKAKNAQGQHIASSWILTRRAADFLRGTVNIPKYVYTKKNVVQGHGDELVSKKDFRILDDFGAHWDAIELQDGNVRIVPKVTQQSLL